MNRHDYSAGKPKKLALCVGQRFELKTPKPGLQSMLVIMERDEDAKTFKIGTEINVMDMTFDEMNDRIEYYEEA